MAKTPELKTKLKIIINIIVPFCTSLMLLDWKLGDDIPGYIFTVAMGLGVIWNILNLIIIKWNKTIEDSKSEKLQKIESITANMALFIIGIVFLLWVFWRK